MKALIVSVSILFSSILYLTCGDAQARQFKQALPGFKFSFPRDHGSHEEYKTEWWYYTGHLLTEDKRPFGFELTFFRTGLDNDASGEKSPWQLKNVYLAHFAVSDEKNKKFYFFEKLNRAGLGTAGAAENKLRVFNENWSAEQLGDTMAIEAQTPQFRIHLLLDSAKPPVVHGENGVSQKASCTGCASHYYSLTRLKTRGVLYEGDKSSDVTGLTWMDHEFGSNQLAADQVGWDWYSIQLDNGSELMVYLMRNDKGGVDTNSSGTLVKADGRVKHLNLGDIQVTSSRKWQSQKSKGAYPMSWQISVPSEKIELKLEPTFDEQELVTGSSTGVTYWEGSNSVTGKCGGKSVTGQAYVEMTGYAERFRKNI